MAFLRGPRAPSGLAHQQQFLRQQRQNEQQEQNEQQCLRHQRQKERPKERWSACWVQE